MYFYKIDFSDYSGTKERWHNVQMLASNERISEDEFRILVERLHEDMGDDESIALRLVETGRFQMLPHIVLSVEYAANDEDAEGCFVYKSQTVDDPYKRMRAKHDDLERELERVNEQKSRDAQ